MGAARFIAEGRLKAGWLLCSGCCLVHSEHSMFMCMLHDVHRTAHSPHCTLCSLRIQLLGTFAETNISSQMRRVRSADPEPAGRCPRYPACLGRRAGHRWARPRPCPGDGSNHTWKIQQPLQFLLCQGIGGISEHFRFVVHPEPFVRDVIIDRFDVAVQDLDAHEGPVFPWYRRAHSYGKVPANQPTGDCRGMTLGTRVKIVTDWCDLDCLGLVHVWRVAGCC